MARLAAALAFIALQALAAAWLFLLGVHGPSSLGVAAPLYLVAGAALTWWASRRSWPALLVAGAVLLAAAPGLYLALDQADRIAYQRRVAATQVTDVRDEPILSADRPIGMRLYYQVVAPSRGYFGILPTVYNTEGFGLQARQWTFDGRGGGIEFGRFEPGKRHVVTVDLYPDTLFFGQGGVRCLLPSSRKLPDAGRAAPLRVEISDTPYRADTRGHYDVVAMYRAVLAEGLPACKAPGQ